MCLSKPTTGALYQQNSICFRFHLMSGKCITNISIAIEMLFTNHYLKIFSHAACLKYMKEEWHQINWSEVSSCHSSWIQARNKKFSTISASSLKPLFFLTSNISFEFILLSNGMEFLISWEDYKGEYIVFWWVGK